MTFEDKSSPLARFIACSKVAQAQPEPYPGNAPKQEVKAEENAQD
jgi:hypothetical protein